MNNHHMHSLENTPFIININENSLDDGPGIRTVIFMKGCPLDCAWCQNPESKNPKQELFFHPDNCIFCDPCRVLCEKGAFQVKINTLQLDWERCGLCFKCVEACPAPVFKTIGKQYTISQLVEIISKDLVFYKNSGGGVTLSGGEPLLFVGYTSELIDTLSKMDISIIIETAGYFQLNNQVKNLLKKVDTIYYDLKLFDDNQHKKYCGVPNTKIKENFDTLTKEDWIMIPNSMKDIENRMDIKNKTLLIPRIPLIPGLTSANENLGKWIEFLKIHQIKIIDLLQYNPLWKKKLDSLGKSEDYHEDRWMNSENLIEVRNMFKDFKFLTFNPH